MSKERISKYFLGLVLLFFSNIIFGQNISGVIQGDNAFLLVRPSVDQSLADFFKSWGLAGTSDTSKLRIFIPLAGKLRYDDCTGCLPVYHEVKKGDNLYRISQWYGSIAYNEIKLLNGLRSNNLSVGQQLLVGYLSPPNDSTDFIHVNREKIPVAIDAVRQNKKSLYEDEVSKLTYHGVGVFEAEWQPSTPIHQTLGKASVFKTESGWNNGRFYLLHNTLPIGQVVKLTEPLSGNFIYAKVVGPLPQIKMNNGLTTRINVAAAALLGLTGDTVFEILIQY